MKKYDVTKLPDGRGNRSKYPWGKLESIGDFFVWDNVEDRVRIRAASDYQKIKISCRNVDGKLHVIRIK